MREESRIQRYRRRLKLRPSRSVLTGSRIFLSKVAYRVFDKLFEDEVFGRAAQLAYYWLFALFPLMIFLTALLAFLPIRKDWAYVSGMLSDMLPPDAYSLVIKTLQEIINYPRGGLLSFSILIAIWVSSSGMEAIITSLNIAYDAPPTRSWWQERLLAIWLTFGLTIFILTALTLMFFGEEISARLANAYGFGEVFKFVWAWAQWPIVIFLVFLGLDLIYYFAPNIRHRWKYFSPGAIFAVTLWLLVSFGFRLYVSRFANYNATYGTLGGVMILMLWFYLTGLAILIGGEINSVVRQS